MTNPNLTDEEIQLAQAGMSMMQKGAELVPADVLNALYKWAKWWSYYQDFLKNKSKYEREEWTEERKNRLLQKLKSEQPAEYDNLTWKDKLNIELLEKLEIWLNDYSDQCTFDDFDGNWFSCPHCNTWSDEPNCICYAR